MDIVYSDQVWNQSNCLLIENVVNRALRSATESTDFQVCLVDAVNPQVLRSHACIITDNVLIDQKWPLWPEYYGSFFYNPQYQDRLPTALFACFINRACPFRQSWLYQFARRGILDQGLISYRLDYRHNDHPCPITNSDRLLLFDEMFRRGNAIFAQEHALLRNKVPLQTFDVELEQAIIDSKISLVIETYFDTDGIISFSEKIFRNLLIPRPWMLFSVPGAVAHLRKVGFDVMDDLVNHEYDQIANEVSRQIYILDQLQNWRNIDITTNMIDRMKQACYTNCVLLKSLREALPGKIQQIINSIRDTRSELY